MQTFWLFLHILGAAAWFGASVFTLLTDRMMGAESAAVKAGWYRKMAKASGMLYGPAAVVVLISGVFLVLGNDAYGFGSAFVSLGFLTIIFGVFYGIRIVAPAAERAAQAYDRGDDAGGKVALAGYRRLGVVDVSLVAVTIAAMVWRIGA